ncbi:MAG: GTPase HflX [Opitutales bacterium]|nr:GTPase HflX [Opitutales bacterium]
MIEVREKPKMVERAFLVGVRMVEESAEFIDSLLDELAELVGTLRIGCVGRTVAKIRESRPRFLLGSGKVEEILQEARDLRADCLVFDAELTPAQQRNWEKATGLCVIDRQEIILDIFSERAQTREAVLQVALARAEHSLPRLKNAWTHLSRQRGGGVAQRGEGEAQIELDSRMVRQRISRLKRELEAVVRHRHTQRKLRERVPLPTAAIVGYTNAGKSTLLNALTGAHVLAEDKLFATLDPTTRQLPLEGGRKILLTDTVGFVQRLPHQLVDAFKATLEEAVVADYLIHVLDASHPEVTRHAETTLSVLKELGAADKHIITVYNKVDQIPLEDRPLRAGKGGSAQEGFGTNGRPDVFYVSARSGQGLGCLASRLDDLIRGSVEVAEFFIPHDRYEIVARLHAAGAVRHEKAKSKGVHIVGSVPERMRETLEPYRVTG